MLLDYSLFFHPRRYTDILKVVKAVNFNYFSSQILAFQELCRWKMGPDYGFSSLIIKGWIFLPILCNSQGSVTCSYISVLGGTRMSQTYPHVNHINPCTSVYVLQRNVYNLILQMIVLVYLHQWNTAHRFSQIDNKYNYWNSFFCRIPLCFLVCYSFIRDKRIAVIVSQNTYRYYIITSYLPRHLHIVHPYLLMTYPKWQFFEQLISNGHFLHRHLSHPFLFFL